MLSSFQVFDCKSLWRIEIQSCGLTSNHIQYLLCFSLVCVIVCAGVFVCASTRACSSLFESGARGRWQRGIDLHTARESYETVGDARLLELKGIIDRLAA